MDEKYWSDADIYEFEKLCEPAVEFLKMKCPPKMSILVEWDGAVLVKDVCGVSFDVPD